MRVGAATHKIILPDGFLPTEGFARQIDELHVRALVLEKERRLALLAVELTSLPPEEIKALKAIACAASGAERAFVCATHTFSAPHFMPDHQLDEAGRAKKEQLREAVQNAAREAARGCCARHEGSAAHLRRSTMRGQHRSRRRNAAGLVD